VEEKIDCLRGAQVFSLIDLTNGFFHVPVEEESRKYTAFVTPDGHYEFMVTPFGLCNSPASFLRFVTEVFQDLIQRKIVIIYVDDIVIPGSSYEDGYEKLVMTVKVAEEHGLLINWRKCSFLTKKIEFLGHEIEQSQIRPAKSKINVVVHFPEPSTKQQVASFLGLTGYFRKFVHNYARIARPLSDLLKDGKSFCMGPEQRQAIATLKRVLSQEPVLRIYNPDAVTELHTELARRVTAAYYYRGIMMKNMYILYITGAGKRQTLRKSITRMSSKS